jgi:hypothetical protein
LSTTTYELISAQSRAPQIGKRSVTLDANETALKDGPHHNQTSSRIGASTARKIIRRSTALAANVTNKPPLKTNKNLMVARKKERSVSPLFDKADNCATHLGDKEYKGTPYIPHRQHSRSQGSTSDDFIDKYGSDNGIVLFVDVLLVTFQLQMKRLRRYRKAHMKCCRL